MLGFSNCCVFMDPTDCIDFKKIRIPERTVRKAGNIVSIFKKTLGLELLRVHVDAPDLAAVTLLLLPPPFLLPPPPPDPFCNAI